MISTTLEMKYFLPLSRSKGSSGGYNHPANCVAHAVFIMFATGANTYMHHICHTG